VLFYDLSKHTLDTQPISRDYGVQNLHRDISVELEQGPSVLESHASQLIGDLHKVLHTGVSTAKRRDVNHLRKFLFVMHYRRDLLSNSYFQKDHSENRPLRDWIESFQQKHGLRDFDRMLAVCPAILHEYTTCENMLGRGGDVQEVWTRQAPTDDGDQT